jgi:signal transduction histidine kinase
MGSMGAVRCGFVALVLVFALLSSETVEVSPAELTIGSAAYLLLVLLTPWIVQRQPRNRAQWVITLSLLADGVYLCWATYATGGTLSPLRFLLLVARRRRHPARVLLARAWKIAVWDSLLYLVILYAQAREPRCRSTRPSPRRPRSGVDLKTAMLQLIPLWAAALVTATCAAVSDRELRAQKVDLEELSGRRAGPGAADVRRGDPEILLDALCRVFGFGRGVVLASPGGRPVAQGVPGGRATRRICRRGTTGSRSGPGNERRAQLVARLDPESDPRLAAAAPGSEEHPRRAPARGRGFRLGVVAVEQSEPAGPDQAVGVVVLVEQFATHAALTLQNAWLLDELERQARGEPGSPASARVQEPRSRGQGRRADEGSHEELLRRSRAWTNSDAGSWPASSTPRRTSVKRIAGDIHDDPIQKIVATSMRLQLMRHQLSDPEQLEVLDKLLSTVRARSRASAI